MLLYVLFLCFTLLYFILLYCRLPYFTLRYLTLHDDISLYFALIYFNLL